MEYELTKEDIAVIYKPTAPTQYFVSADTDGNILSISNLIPDAGNIVLVTNYESVKGFLLGNWIVNEYKVVSNKIIKKPIEVIPDWAYSRFKIIDDVAEDPEVIITWSKDQWQFELSEEILAKYSLHFTLHFYVVLENNLDFLIRQLDISFVNGKAIVPFEHRLEQDITKIKLVTAPVFSRYKLIVQ